MRPDESIYEIEFDNFIEDMIKGGIIKSTPNVFEQFKRDMDRLHEQRREMQRKIEQEIKP